MITKLTLTNFKKHENLVIDFAAGLTALKGANEAGKSTVYHGIVYALFGARALPLTLAETVTYDKPETSLKVELVFTFEGATYTVTRSKSGAVITNGTVTANGQVEVTKFVEKLFGVNADAATKLMVASQGGLRGALESGEAVPLIEKLANIDLIDQLIAKMQAQLPCGNTKQIVEALEIASQAVKPVLNTEDLEPMVRFAKASVELAEHELKQLQLEDTTDEVLQRSIINKVTAAEQRHEQIKKDLGSMADRIAIEPTKPEVDVELAKIGLEAFKEESAKLKAYKQWLARPTNNACIVNFNEVNAGKAKELEGLTEAIMQHKLAISTYKALLITETACGLCGKDLTDVPEVVAKNKVTQAKINEALQHIVALEEQSASVTDTLKYLKTLQEIDQIINSTYIVTQNYTIIDRTVVPARLVWSGDIPDPDRVWPDYIAEIREGERLLRDYDRAMAVYKELGQQQDTLLAELSSLDVNTPAKEKAQELLAQKVELTARIATQTAYLNECKLAYKDADSNLKQATSRFNTEMEAYEKSLETKAKLEESLAAMVKNNALIKKLRDVRPIVAARLWAIVLASVSNYFTQIRGTPSVVARSASSFTVGGKNVGGLSGSTLDALGLAIRMALSKTFLPSIDFILLDEPAAGMDEDRETAMLGLLASTGYQQVVVVTHSELADSFASSVVQL